MNYNYINIYNNFVNLTTNKSLYVALKSQDTFSDRLTIFLIHFAFFLKTFKKKEDKNILQKIYDFNFRQMELSIREIGYGDQSINKKMKDYINLFHSIISEIHYWENLDINKKEKIIRIFLSNHSRFDHLVEYFDNFYINLSKKTLNSYLKSVSNQ